MILVTFPSLSLLLAYRSRSVRDVRQAGKVHLG